MSKVVQSSLSFSRRGGARPGAGRKRSTRSGVPHRARSKHVERHPLHVTLRIVDGVPSLREHGAHRTLRRALAESAGRLGLRVVQYSAQSNHLHLIVEAVDERALSCGMKGLGVRIARALNRVWGRTGKVIAERFHARALKTPREVRNALAYVLRNASKHGTRMRTILDPFSSAASFDGWIEHGPLARSCLARATTWLLTLGWKRHGPISVVLG